MFFSKPKKHVRANTPSGNVISRFEAKKDFYSKETHSQYSKGMIYSVREGNVMLQDLGKIWEQEDKIKWL